MGAETGIEWTDATWSPVKGCSRISPGCVNCYAETLAGRFCGPGLPMEGFATRGPSGARWTGRVELAAERLAIPVRWQRPRRIFVNSQSDTFHEKLSNEDILAVFGAMAAAPHHTFQVLTKRAQRMREWFEWAGSEIASSGRFVAPALAEHAACSAKRAGGEKASDPLFRACNLLAGTGSWPLPNVWLGVSVEDQERAEERIPHLTETPAAVRFLSCEPLLGTLDLSPWLGAPPRDWGGASDGGEDPALDWAIVGGESGSDARPMDLAWARSIVEQCRAASVPVFVKQLGAVPLLEEPPEPSFAALRPELQPEAAWPDGTRFGNPTGKPALNGRVVILRDRKGGDWDEWPEDLRVREFPEVTRG